MVCGKLKKIQITVKQIVEKLTERLFQRPSCSTLFTESETLDKAERGRGLTFHGRSQAMCNARATVLL